MSIKMFDTLLNLTTMLSNAHFIKSKNKYEYYSDLNTLFKNSYTNKIILKQHQLNNLYMLRCWKSKCFYNYILDDHTNTNFIGGINYNIDKENDYIKIEYLTVNNDYYNRKYNNPIILNEYECQELKRSLIKYMENIAIYNNISKIIIDVHSNLLRYNEEFLEEGFIITQRCSIDNPLWIEIEKYVSK